MSIVYVKESFEQRSAEVRQKTGLYTRQYQRVFKVQFDNIYEGTYFALVASHGGVTIPQLGWAWSDGHPTEPQYDPTSRAVAVVARPDKEDPYAQIVIASYSSSWGSGDVGGGEIYPDPVDPWPQNQWQWGTIVSVEPVEESVPGDPTTLLQSSAGEQFDPLPTVEYRDPVLTVSRGEFASKDAAFVGAHIRQYKGSVSNAVFCGYPIKHAWMASITASTAFRANVWYWQMRYEIRLRNVPWTPRKFLDRGLGELRGDPAEWVHMRDGEGTLLSEPVLLDGSGHRLPQGGDPVYLDRKWHDEADWAPLQLLDMPK